MYLLITKPILYKTNSCVSTCVLAFLTDKPCITGFGDSDVNEFGFVTHRDTGDGETFSTCWSMEFYEGSLTPRVLQIAFNYHAITSDEACIQVVIIRASSRENLSSGFPTRSDTNQRR